jgi:hypothetical protein
VGGVLGEVTSTVNLAVFRSYVPPPVEGTVHTPGVVVDSVAPVLVILKVTFAVLTPLPGVTVRLRELVALQPRNSTLSFPVSAHLTEAAELLLDTA